MSRVQAIMCCLYSALLCQAWGVSYYLWAKRNGGLLMRILVIGCFGEGLLWGSYILGVFLPDSAWTEWVKVATMLVKIFNFQMFVYYIKPGGNTNGAE